MRSSHTRTKDRRLLDKFLQTSVFFGWRQLRLLHGKWQQPNGENLIQNRACGIRVRKSELSPVSSSHPPTGSKVKETTRWGGGAGEEKDDISD